MATFKIRVSPHRKADGTRNVQIRVFHNGKGTSVSTPMFAEPYQLTRSLRIKDHALLESCEKIIHEWRRAVVELGSVADTLSVQELITMLRASGENRYGFRLDFVAYLREVARHKKANTAHNYTVVASSLDHYVKGRTLDINEVSASFLVGYEGWLRNRNISPNTIYLYMSAIKAAFNQARLTYNDDDIGNIRVRVNPFAKYHLPQLPAPSARGISLETLQAIANLDDESRVNSRRNFARDIFMLSYALGGMNYADIYSLPYASLRKGYIEYHRQKTADARADGALYRVRVEPEVQPLVARYLDPTRQRLFRFHLRYTETSFKAVVSQAMHTIVETLPYERHYTFYAARHTYATLARNIVGLDKYTVHELLNHSDSSMKITDRYIERDWQRLFDAHRQVILLVDWSKICKDE